ncbi:MAG: MarC family protein [Opitutales bacterium]|nr:MarC family protein [Opitutales bacterium]
MDLPSAIILLIIVMDPLGNIPPVITLLEGVRRKRWFILRESVLALAVLLFFLYFGPFLLRTLDLSQEAIQLAGGIILFLIALKMIFAMGPNWIDSGQGEEPILFPLAVPLIAGPSAAATVMLFAAQDPGRMITWTLAVLVASAVSTAVLFGAPALHRIAGGRGLAAIQRLMGLLLTAISVEMMLDAIRTLL